MNKEKLLSLLPTLPDPKMYWKLWEDKAYPGGPTVYDEVNLAIMTRRMVSRRVEEPKDPIRRRVFWDLYRGRFREADTKPKEIRYEDRECEVILVSTMFFDDEKLEGASDEYLYNHITDTLSLHQIKPEMVKRAVKMLLKRLDSVGLAGEYRTEKEGVN